MRIGLSLLITMLLAAAGLAAGAEDAASPEPQPALRVAADESLASVLPQLAQAWADQQTPAARVELDVGNASTLRQRLEQGEPWDAVLLAAGPDTEALTAAGVLAPEPQRRVARVFVAVLGRRGLIADEELEWKDLIREEWAKVAVPDPKHSAAGRAAMACLTDNQLADALRDRLLVTPSVRHAIDAVQRSEADAVLAFRPDFPAQNLGDLVVFDAGAPPVFFLAAPVAKSPRTAAARQWLDFLVSPEAEPIWRAAGFLDPLPSPAAP